MTHVAALLDRALEGRRLLDHPFYRRWEAGELQEGELARYAEQYRFFEAKFPSVLASLAEAFGSGPAYDAVTDNLRDETAEPSHVALFEDFARGVGAEHAVISPAMSALLRTYDELLNESPAAGLAGVAAYEAQGAAIASSKADGLRRHYDAPATTTRFWDVHGMLEEDHAAWTNAGIAALNVDDELVVASAGRVAQAWWDFLTERDQLVAA